MEIVSVLQDGNFMVTLHMSDMPSVVTTCFVYIAGELQGGKPQVSPVAQTIVVRANENAQKGRISVTITPFSGGDDVTAESDEDYIPPTEVPVDERPVVNSLSRTTVKPGERLSMRGQRLRKVNGVFLQNYICQSVTALDASVTFTVPENTKPEDTPYTVFIKTSTSPVRINTGKPLKIVAT